MNSSAVPPQKCPVCGSSNGFTEFCGASFLPGDKKDIIECKNCGVSILWPRPSMEDFTEFYGSEYYNFDRASEQGKGYYYADILKKIKIKGRYLEIGSALGWFLHGIKCNSEWEIHGLETGKTAAVFSREKLGLNIKETRLIGAEYPENYFDFIRFNNVLEHLPDPAEAFAEAARILAPEGTLYIAVPNGAVDRLDYKEYFRKKQKPGASRDGHVFFFSKISLQELARANELKITEAYSGGIKRALRARGLWPRKKGWEAVHEAKTQPAGQGQTLPDKVEELKKPELYYKYLLYRDLYKRLPGLLSFASDYIIYFQKVK